MGEITREQFAAAVAAAISSVQHLYKEVDKLMAGLREALAEEPEPLAPVKGTVQSTGKDPSRMIIRNEYGALFQASSGEEEDGDADGEEEEAGDDGEGGSVGGKQGSAGFAADEALLAVRVLLHHPRETVSFEPTIDWAILADWNVGPRKPQPG